MITSELYLTLQIGSRRHIPKKLRKAGALLAKNYIELFAMYNGISPPHPVYPLYRFSLIRKGTNIVSINFNTTTPVDLNIGRTLNLYLHTINTKNWWKT